MSTAPQITTNELKERLAALERRLETLRGIFDVPGTEARLKVLDEQVGQPDFWNDHERAQKVQRERSHLTAGLDGWKRQRSELDDANVFLELAVEGDPDALPEGVAKADQVDQGISNLEMRQMLGGEHDAGNAILEIHPGAGGLEAQDWAEMLFRMYLRWCERKGYKVEILEQQEGEGAGIKSVTMTIGGDYAYGYLHAEGGVHRLVRISPFDANARRQTSFASVFVYPEIEDDIEVEINDVDLRVDTYRSSGAGGQHVNKTDSAVRLTHLPTGIVVACQNERSQHKNRAMAMKILRARLYDLEMQKQKEKLDAFSKNKKEIGFGSQIRSYVLHPYRMVKDHRTSCEVGNADGVLDGDLDKFIQAYLLSKIGG